MIPEPGQYQLTVPDSVAADVEAIEVAAFDFTRVILCTLCIAYAVKRLLLLKKG